jgi:hypothetical protein
LGIFITDFLRADALFKRGRRKGHGSLGLAGPVHERRGWHF